MVHVGTKHRALEEAFRSAAQELDDAERKAAEFVKESTRKGEELVADAEAEAKAIVAAAGVTAKDIVAEAEATAAKAAEAAEAREAALAEREAKWKTIEHSMEEFKSRVKLNVGGTKFETTKATLEQFVPEGMLALMFSGRFKVDSDKDDYVFLDRDGTHFRKILNFLRTGHASWYDDKHKDEELRQELQFYMLLEAFENAISEQFIATMQAGDEEGKMGHFLLVHRGNDVRVIGFDDRAKSYKVKEWFKEQRVIGIEVRAYGMPAPYNGQQWLVGALPSKSFYVMFRSGPDTNVDDFMREQFEATMEEWIKNGLDKRLPE